MHEIREWQLRDVELAVKHAVRRGLMPKRRAQHETGRPLMFTEEDILESQYEPLIRYLPLLKAKKREDLKLPANYEPFESQQTPNEPEDPPDRWDHDTPVTPTPAEVQPILARLERLTDKSAGGAVTPASALEIIAEQNHLIRDLFRLLISEWMALNPQDLDHLWELWKSIYTRLDA